ncbi:IS200/IS605 family transposase [Candidatus Pacearchaeota archaeon CG10_big_fil_rev_8_21_14_0_10_35_13]|nr:MAG: IS200/IS605 family transposase [Candidatus Pacearchaeota archaeon CG10_big_fil_rev_8_21_14_0_10_35_13]
MVEQLPKLLKIENTKGNSCVYNINYHIVFCPKYRKQVLNESIKEDLEIIFKSVISSNDWKLLELEIMPDHIHLFVSAHPKQSPLEIVKKLKGISARLIFKKYPKFQKKEFWGKHLWSGGYYVGTAGIVTAESIQKYILAQTKTNSSDD